MRPQDVLDPERTSQLAAVILAGLVAKSGLPADRGVEQLWVMWSVKIARRVRVAAAADNRDWSQADTVKKDDTALP